MHRSIVTLRVGPTRSGLLAALLCGPLPLWGQGARPIRIIVPLTPGGSTDILARALAPKLAQALGRNVIGDNKPRRRWLAPRRPLADRMPARGFSTGVGESSTSPSRCRTGAMPPLPTTCVGSRSRCAAKA